MSDSCCKQGTFSWFQISARRKALSQEKPAFGTASSTFLGLGAQMTQDYDSNGNHQDAATAYLYSTSTPLNNLIRTNDYGQVTGSSDGTFTDTGSDSRLTDLSYAATTTSVTATTTTSGVNTNSLSLVHASSQYESISNASQSGLNMSGDFTVEAWVKLTSLPSVGVVLDTHQLNLPQYKI